MQRHVSSAANFPESLPEKPFKGGFVLGFKRMAKYPEKYEKYIALTLVLAVGVTLMLFMIAIMVLFHNGYLKPAEDPHREAMNKALVLLKKMNVEQVTEVVELLQIYNRTEV